MIEKNTGTTYTPKLLTGLTQGLVYGDLLMRLLYRVRPYELVEGSANKLHREWEAKCRDAVTRGSWKEYKNNIYAMVKDFDTLPIKDEKKTRVGVVGEILVKFSPAANNHLVDLLEAEGAEVVMPDLLDFFLYGMYNSNFKNEELGFSKMYAFGNNMIIKVVNLCRRHVINALNESERFDAPIPIDEIAQSAKQVVSLGNQTGEGWFLTGEMIELINGGVSNIVCAQPFACLPNHIVGKGAIKKIKTLYPKSNIVPIDYDPGASEVNQLNRIKLMLSTANSFDEL